MKVDRASSYLRENLVSLTIKELPCERGSGSLAIFLLIFDQTTGNSGAY